MSMVICAIRGGAQSQSTIRAAIDLAKEGDRPLAFLYVVNVDFLSRSNQSRARAIREEMREMGEFILLLAHDLASSQGIPATTVVRQGDVREEILRLCRETSAGAIVLGAPARESHHPVFTTERMTRFVQQAGEQCGAKVVLA